MTSITEADELEQLRFLAMGRAGVGAAFMLFPGLALRGWIGRPNPGSKVIGRAFGARDLVMGIATLKALETGDKAQARFWAQAGMASDAVDLAATWMGAKSVPKRNLVSLTLMAGGATLLGARIAKSLT